MSHPVIYDGMISRWLVVLLTVVACSKKAPTPTPGDCARVAGKTVDRQMKAGMEAGAKANGASITPEVQAEMDRLHNDMAGMFKPVKDAVAKACTDDQWSADAVACLDAATTPEAIGACDAKLTAAQRTHIEAATKDAMAKAAPAGSPACTRYADLEIKCGSAKDSDRPVILDFCTKARAGAKGTTYQLIALESRCAETAADCDAYKQCVEKSKAETTPEP